MRNKSIPATILAVLISFTPLLSNSPATAADNSKVGQAQAEASIMIEAPPTIVWKAVHMERQQDPDIAYSKVVQDLGNTKFLEQKFVNIPILGSVTAVTRQVEDLNHRIDYCLVRSDKFKALNGSWELVPINGGKGTQLQLQSSLDLGIPFSNMFIKGAAQKKLEHRLAHVKQLAEDEQARVARTDKALPVPF